jgi:large subunit ribosomal protein L21
MKKAVIATGGKQYLVTEGETLLVEKLNSKDAFVVEPYLVIDGDNVTVGEPTVTGAKVSVSVVDEEVRAPKVMVQKFQSKKRVRSLKGHRQSHTRIKIDSIA